MNRSTISLTLVELFAIKHALQKQVFIKKRMLENEYTGEISNFENAIKLEKDIEHEEALISMFENEIVKNSPRKAI